MFTIMNQITFNNLSRADGSALIDQENTIIQATVFGPVRVSQAKINTEEAVLDILYKPKVSIPSILPEFGYVREVENLLKLVFKEVILTKLHPSTGISILVQEIHNAGSLLSATINAVCCALIDAGVPMSCMVAAVTIDLENCRYDFVFNNNLNMVTLLTKGHLNEANLAKAIALGQDKAKTILDRFRDEVRRRFT